MTPNVFHDNELTNLTSGGHRQTEERVVRLVERDQGPVDLLPPCRPRGQRSIQPEPILHATL